MLAQHRNLWRIWIVLAGLLLGGGVAAAPAHGGLAAPFAALTTVCSTASFGPATNFAVGTYPEAVAVGDFNRDGNPDLVTANYSSNNLTVRLGNGTGGFGAAASLAVGTNPDAVALG